MNELNDLPINLEKSGRPRGRPTRLTPIQGAIPKEQAASKQPKRKRKDKQFKRVIEEEEKTPGLVSANPTMAHISTQQPTVTATDPIHSYTNYGCLYEEKASVVESHEGTHVCCDMVVHHDSKKPGRRLRISSNSHQGTSYQPHPPTQSRDTQDESALLLPRANTESCHQHKHALSNPHPYLDNGQLVQCSQANKCTFNNTPLIDDRTKFEGKPNKGKVETRRDMGVLLDSKNRGRRLAIGGTSPQTTSYQPHQPIQSSGTHDGCMMPVSPQIPTNRHHDYVLANQQATPNILKTLPTPDFHGFCFDFDRQDCSILHVPRQPSMKRTFRSEVELNYYSSPGSSPGSSSPQLSPEGCFPGYRPLGLAVRSPVAYSPALRSPALRSPALRSPAVFSPIVRSPACPSPNALACSKPHMLSKESLTDSLSPSSNGSQSEYNYPSTSGLTLIAHKDNRDQTQLNECTSRNRVQADTKLELCSSNKKGSTPREKIIDKVRNHFTFPSLPLPGRWLIPKREKQQPTMIEKSKNISIEELFVLDKSKVPEGSANRGGMSMRNSNEQKDGANTSGEGRNNQLFEYKAEEKRKKSLYTLTEFLKLCDDDDFDGNEENY